MDTSKFVGMEKRQAQNKAEQENMIFRLIRVDDKNFFAYPEDTRTDRLCVEIDKGCVSKATIK